MKSVSEILNQYVFEHTGAENAFFPDARHVIARGSGGAWFVDITADGDGRLFLLPRGYGTSHLFLTAKDDGLEVSAIANNTAFCYNEEGRLFYCSDPGSALLPDKIDPETVLLQALDNVTNSVCELPKALFGQ